MRTRNLTMKTVVKVAVGFWRIQRETEREMVNFHFTLVWFHAPWDIPNLPVYVLLDYINVTNFVLPYRWQAHMHKQTHLQTQHERQVGWMWAAGCCPHSKLTWRRNSCPLLSPVYLTCDRQVFDENTSMSSSHQMSPHKFPPGSIGQWIWLEVKLSSD